MRIRSVTLMELLVAMTISAILISLVVGLYLIVQKNFINSKGHYDRRSGLALFEDALRTDFALANHVEWQSFNGKLLCFGITDTVVYQFEKRRIIRNQDTIPVVVYRLIGYFEGNKTINNAVDAMQIFLEKERFIFVSKLYDASFYINRRSVDFSLNATQN